MNEKSIQVYKGRKANLESETYFSLLERVVAAKTFPKLSNFSVQEIALGSQGTILLGGNSEYGQGRSIHGESSIVSNAAQYLQAGEKIISVGIIMPKITNDNYTSPCGDCRDILAGHLGTLIDAEQFELFTGDFEHKTLHIAKFEDYLVGPNEMQEADEIGKQRAYAQEAAVKEALQKTNDTWVEEGAIVSYGAVVVTKEGRAFGGSLQSTLGYDPTYPLTDALANMRHHGIAPTEISHVVIASADEHAMADPMYRDRQDLQDKTADAEALDGQKMNVPVYIMNLAGKKQQRRVIQTDSDAWLPLPFSARQMKEADPARKEKHDKTMYRVYNVAA